MRGGYIQRKGYRILFGSSEFIQIALSANGRFNKVIIEEDE
jgi:hypothetical protein